MHWEWKFTFTRSNTEKENSRNLISIARTFFTTPEIHLLEASFRCLHELIKVERTEIC